MQPLKIFIGYDAVESISWHVLVHSIIKHSTIPVSIIPVALNNLQGVLKRERDPKQSNEFSFSRFLAPYLAGYEGHAIFMDCDMMFRVDVAELIESIGKGDKAVYVVKHDYTPSETVKYLGNVQHVYPRKNWSSFVVWNCGHPSNKAVTPEFVNTATGLELHRFTWLEDDEIGELDVRWNWLVGDYKDPPADVKNVHWTIGGPYFNEYKDVDFAEEWFAERDETVYCKQLTD